MVIFTPKITDIGEEGIGPYLHRSHGSDGITANNLYLRDLFWHTLYNHGAECNARIDVTLHVSIGL